MEGWDSSSMLEDAERLSTGTGASFIYNIFSMDLLPTDSRFIYIWWNLVPRSCLADYVSYNPCLKIWDDLSIHIKYVIRFAWQ